MPWPWREPAAAPGHASPSGNSRSKSPSASTSHTATPPPMVSGRRRSPAAPVTRSMPAPQAPFAPRERSWKAILATAEAVGSGAITAGPEGSGATGAACGAARGHCRHSTTPTATNPTTAAEAQNARPMIRSSGGRSADSGVAFGPVTGHPVQRCRTPALAHRCAASRTPLRALPRDWQQHRGRGRH